MLTIDLGQLPLRPGDRVLDLGCGEGRHAIGALSYFPAIEVAALDLSLADLQRARQRHHDFHPPGAERCLYTQGDGAALPFADASFDHVICSEVLEHVPDYHAILSEIHRVLKAGGTLALSVPRYWPEKICWRLSAAYHQVEGGHIRIFTRRQLMAAVMQRPYVFLRRHWAHALHVPYWWLRCLCWQRGEHFWAARLYHRFLVWDLLKRPWLTRALDALLNPVMGKSLVLYFRKPDCLPNPD